MSRVYESTQTIPVSYQNIPFTQYTQGGLPSHLDFHYRGSGFELFMVHTRWRPDSIVVDVKESINENNQLNLPSLNLRNQLPGELKAFRVIPEFISQSFTTRSGKRVPVIAKTSFSFRNRFAQSGRLVLTPDSIDIAGSDEILATINAIQTEVIKIDDIHENVFGSVHLSKELPAGVALSEPYIYYYLTVEEYTEGEFDIPVELPVAQRRRVTLLPPVVKVRFQADLNHFRNIKASDFQVVTMVPLPDQPAQLTVELKRHPANIKKIRLEPRVIDYLLSE